MKYKNFFYFIKTNFEERRFLKIINQNTSILDYGCGEGVWSSSLVKKVYLSRKSNTGEKIRIQLLSRKFFIIQAKCSCYALNPLILKDIQPRITAGGLYFIEFEFTLQGKKFNLSSGYFGIDIWPTDTTITRKTKTISKRTKTKLKGRRQKTTTKDKE